MTAVVGRLAPSPTGYLHLGNIRTFLWAWLSARSQGGRVAMRIEDLDVTRVRTGWVERLLDDFTWLGFDWDGEPMVQTARRDHYAEVFKQLRPHLYPCGCTRGDIAAAQSAPNEGDVEPRYPGLCRNCEVEVPRAWRLRVPEGPVEFDDLFTGRGSYDVAATVGDFVVAKTPEWPAYQLAVVIDDIAQGVTEVVRGDDLLPSTARQILVYRALGITPPRTGHAPLVVGEDGKRLAKRNSATHIGTLRSAGVTPKKIIAALARWSGLPDKGTPRDLIGDWDWRRLSRDRIVLTPARLGELS